jgi:hypothetical protein
VLPERRARWIAAVVALWLVLLLALAAWWSMLVYRQAMRIAELEAQLGHAAGSAAAAGGMYVQVVQQRVAAVCVVQWRG